MSPTPVAMSVILIIPGHRWTIFTSVITRVRVITLVMDTIMVMAVAGQSGSAMVILPGITLLTIMVTVTVIIIMGVMGTIDTTTEIDTRTMVMEVTGVMVVMDANAVMAVETGAVSIQMTLDVLLSVVAVETIPIAGQQHQ